MDVSTAETLAARTYLYTLLHRLFAEEPNDGLAKTVDADLMGEAMAIIGCDAERCGESLAGVVHALNDVDACRLEYTRLFIGPGKLPAPPWESVWTLKDRAIFTRVTLDVRTAYRASGFLPASYPQVSDDHVALELDFMAHLARRMQEAYERSDVKALEADRAASANFLENHLETWVNPFAERLAQENAPLYGSAAAILADVLQRDAELLREEYDNERIR